MRGISASACDLRGRSLWRTFSICLFLLIFLFLTTAQAADQPKRGYKGSISKEQLIEKLKVVQGKKDKLGYPKPVQGYVIDGNDIIDIIRATDLNIQIKDAVIENGLDFRKLKKVPIDQLIATEQNPGQKKHLEKLKQSGVKAIAQVRSSIAITNSEIHTFKEKGLEYSTFANETIFASLVTFRSATFSGIADFTSATFNGIADFGFAMFSGTAYFRSTMFSGTAYFRSTMFSGIADFTSAMFSGLAVFRFAMFSGLAVFRFATFSSNAGFDSTTFSGDVDFDSATFNGIAGFGLATFGGDADFRGAYFDGTVAYFVSTTFNRIRLSHSQLKAFADFRKSRICKLDFNSSFTPTIFNGRIDFRNAMIESSHIQDVIFANDADFSGARFESWDAEEAVCKTDKDASSANMSTNATVFRFVTFEKEARFNRTAFTGSLAFENSIFKGEAYFTDVSMKALKKLSLSYLSFRGIKLDWDALPEPSGVNFTPWVGDQADRVKTFSDFERESLQKIEQKIELLEQEKGAKSGSNNIQPPEYKLEPLSKVFGQLEGAFEAQKKLADANEASYFRQLAKLREIQHKLKDQQKKEYWPVVRSELEWYFWGLPTGYGTKIWRLLGISAIIWLLFAMLYAGKAELHREQHPGAVHDFSFKLRLLDLPKQFYSPNSAAAERGPGMTQWVNAMRFSWVILFKTGYRDTTATGSILGVDVKYIIWFEWLLGYAVLAAIVVTLTNTMPIANALITGVF